MKLNLKRIYFAPTYTIGKLYVDGVKFCDVLEDKVREDGIKIYGQTAIPEGSYNVIMTMSNRFKKVLPLIQNVPNFEGIRIHAGNTAEDTHGCLLVGINDEKGRVNHSRETMSKLMVMLEKADKIEITIE
jgi:hypothetical protein